MDFIRKIWWFDSYLRIFNYALFYYSKCWLFIRQVVHLNPWYEFGVLQSSQTPKHSFYLSNLDDQKFLRFSIKYLYHFKKSVSSDNLKYSLSRVLVDYYPLARRLRVTAEAFMDITAEDFLQLSNKPSRSWRKLLYRVEALIFLDVPPLVVQVLFLLFCYANISFILFAFPYITLKKKKNYIYIYIWGYLPIKLDLEKSMIDLNKIL